MIIVLSFILFSIVLIFLLIIWKILSILLRFIEKKWIKKELIPIRYKLKLRISIILLIITYSGFSTYTAIYPLKSFYIEEWEYFTKIELPENTVIIARSAEYPSIHGDYCSCAIFKFDKKNYNIIRHKINNDNNYSDTLKMVSSVLDEVIKNSGLKKTDFKNNKGKFNNRNLINLEFIDNKQLILFQACHR